MALPLLIPVALAAGAAYLLFGSKASAQVAPGVSAPGGALPASPYGGAPAPGGGTNYVPPGGNIPLDPSQGGGYGGTTLGPGGSNTPLGGAATGTGESASTFDPFTAPSSDPGSLAGTDPSTGEYGGFGPAAGATGTAAGALVGQSQDGWAFHPHHGWYREG